MRSTAPPTAATAAAERSDGNGGSGEVFLALNLELSCGSGELTAGREVNCDGGCGGGVKPRIRAAASAGAANIGHASYAEVVLRREIEIMNIFSYQRPNLCNRDICLG